MSHAPIHHIRIATPPTGSFPRLADEDIAAELSANLLLTGAHADVQALVRRIHDAGARTSRPCVQLWARDLPVAPGALRRRCLRLVRAAAGGTALVSDVEEMPRDVQRQFIDLIDELQDVQVVVAARIVTATTVSLIDLVRAGRFDVQLFYRINTIHLVLPVNCPRVPDVGGTGTMAGCRPSH